MEISAVETTVEFSESFSVASITPTSITVVITEGTKLVALIVLISRT